VRESEPLLGLHQVAKGSTNQKGLSPALKRLPPERAQWHAVPPCRGVNAVGQGLGLGSLQARCLSRCVILVRKENRIRIGSSGSE
jgi:hypothetical protein